MNLFEAIKKRRSHRGEYQDRAIDNADLNKLIEAARWTPSPFNVQPWELIIVQEENGKELLAKMTEQAITQQFKDTEFIRKNNRWISLTDTEWDVRGDGVLLKDHVNLPKLIKHCPEKFTQKMLKGILKSEKPLALLGYLGLGKMPAKEIAAQVRQSPLLMLITMNNHRQPPGEGASRWMWLSMGMLVQNILLAATAIDIGVQFVSAPLEAEKDRNRIQQHFNVPNHCEVMTLLRMGYLKGEDRSSVRLDSSEFVHYERFVKQE